MSLPQITLRSLPDGGYVVAERAAFSTMAEAAAYFDKLLARDRVQARVEEIAREHHRGTMAEVGAGANVGGRAAVDAAYRRWVAPPLVAEGNGCCDGA